jgi:hypothetical protein
MVHDPTDDDWIDEALDADPVELDIDECDEPSGPPPSPEEIEAARIALARWQSPDPVEDWIERAESIPKFLDKAISEKIEKHYGSACWLVIYLNISEWGIRQKETEATIAEAKARYASSFEAISVLWKGCLY